VFGRKLSLAKKVKVWELELDELEDEVKDAVIQAGAGVNDNELSKSVPPEQVEAAESLGAKVNMAGIPREKVRDTVRREIYDLAEEYEIARANGSSSALRTRKMNEIAAGMRTLAIAGKALRTELTKSNSVGRRLAAICMLQVDPRSRYFRWLIERLKIESQPFVFYQAAIAVRELVRKKQYADPDDARDQIKAALDVISSYNGGQPDRNTIDALNEALQLLS
jgi:predicted HTH domain antitoxin